MNDSTLTLPVDHEHTGLRLVGCSSLLVVSVGAWLLLNIILPQLSIANVLLALIIGTGGTALVDRLLKGRWASGREVMVTPTAITLQKKSKVETTIDPQKQVNTLMWYFEVKRNSRVKKGWYVIGFALEQNDAYLTSYTFLPPADFTKLPLYKIYTKLEKKDGDDLRQAGLQRRLKVAEEHRSIDGAEMTPEQFQQWFTYLQEQFPKWMPKN